MKNVSKILFKPIEDKTIVWFSTNNEYVVVENETAAILEKRQSGISVKEIASEIAEKLEVPFENAREFILELETHFFKGKYAEDIPQITHPNTIKKPTSYEFVDYYLINEIVCKVSFLSARERELIHPKFAHLVTEPSEKFDHEFEVFIENKKVHLFVNQQFIDAWYNQEVHYFQGKFSMELIQKIHQKEESKWLGVFHASAVSNGKKSILFLGDSGNGKSTSLALLQANGFNCLADDFVPVTALDSEVYSFPAAISIKRNSLQTLLPFYPELETASEYDLTSLNKIVRYLAPKNPDFKAHLPCESVVFIKYEKDSGLQVSSISKIDAFQQLVPDSWLSPIKENAAIFLDWFESLNCYQITYSDNEKMIGKVRELFG